MHRGFEAALLSALEALDGAGLAFSRHPITIWPNIWLRSASEYDVVGGGITILDSRTRNGDGETVVRFTRPHIAFEQSLLVRAEDAARLATHALLASDVRVGVLAGTTGEARLLQLTGLTDAEGNLAAGTRVETPAGTVVADGSSRFRITSAGTTENLLGRTRLLPPDANKPQVIYLGQELGERELLQALERRRHRRRGARHHRQQRCGGGVQRPVHGDGARSEPRSTAVGRSPPSAPNCVRA